MSLVEAVANTVVGFGLAVLAQVAIFPVFGLQASLVQHLQIGATFTILSILRGYALRRAFEALRSRRTEPAP
jgi:hypothetical protein